MKRFPLIAFAACLIAAAAHAQSPAAAPQAAPSPEVPASATEAAPPAADAPAPDTAEPQRLSEANCVRETGSRITKRDGKPRCTGQPGRAYTREDIERTGHLNLSDALRTLDPAVH